MKHDQKVIERIIVRVEKMLNDVKLEDLNLNLEESEDSQDERILSDSRILEAYQEAAALRKSLIHDFNKFCETELRNFQSLCLDTKLFFHDKERFKEKMTISKSNQK